MGHAKDNMGHTAFQYKEHVSVPLLSIQTVGTQARKPSGWDPRALDLNADLAAHAKNRLFWAKGCSSERRRSLARAQELHLDLTFALLRMQTQAVLGAGLLFRATQIAGTPELHPGVCRGYAMLAYRMLLHGPATAKQYILSSGGLNVLLRWVPRARRTVEVRI